MPSNRSFINLQSPAGNSAANSAGNSAGNGNLVVQPPTQQSITQAETGEETYLKFRLAANVPAAIAVRSVQEAFLLPARQLTAMPNMPAPVLGLTNRRNQVIWVLDLAQLLGISVFDPAVQQYSILLIRAGLVQVGLAVRQIEGMVKIAAEAIQAPIGQMSLTLLPYLQGCALLQQEQEILLLLDAEAILQAPVMQDSLPA